MGEIDLGCLALAEIGSGSERVGGAEGGRWIWQGYFGLSLLFIIVKEFHIG